MDWANQSFQIVKTKIYLKAIRHGRDNAPVILPPDYAQREAGITRTQIERAGVRLTTLLNKISGE